MSPLVVSEILCEKHMADIILYLSTFGPRSRTEVYKAISTSPHMAKKLENLENHGIIESYNVEGSKRTMNRLTPLGKTYAEALGQLESASGGEIDDYKSGMIRDVIKNMGRIKTE